MSFTWYVVGVAILVLVSLVIGYLLGLIDGGRAVCGTLRLDHSDPEEPPYLFLELKGHTIDDIIKQEYITLAVKREDFLPRK